MEDEPKSLFGTLVMAAIPGVAVIPADLPAVRVTGVMESEALPWWRSPVENPRNIVSAVVLEKKRRRRRTKRERKTKTTWAKPEFGFCRMTPPGPQDDHVDAEEGRFSSWRVSTQVWLGRVIL